MNIHNSQKKIYLLALIILVAAIVLAVILTVWQPSSKTADDLNQRFSTFAPNTEAQQTVRSVWPDDTGLLSKAETPAPDAATMSTIVYYQDNYGYLVPVMCKVPQEEGIAKATLSMMIQSPENDMQAARLGLRTVLPENTSLDLDISNGTARIDIIGDDLTLRNAAEETNMVTAVVQTLTEFPTVEKVEFLINGKKTEQLPHGTPVGGSFTRGVLNLESISVSSTLKEARMLTLYFPGDSQTVVVPVTRAVYQEPDINTAVLELTKGPNKNSALDCVIPSGCGLIDVQVENGIAKLDFTEDFVNIVNNTDGGRLALKAIMLTCTQFEGINSVEIYVQGELYERLPNETAAPTFMNVAENIIYDYIQAQASMIFEYE